MKFNGSREEIQGLCEWLKDYIVAYIGSDGRRRRQVRDYFTKFDPSAFKTSNENWNGTPLELKKFIFRLSMEQLTKDGLIRTKFRDGLLHNETYVVMNDVLDIMSKIK